MVIKGQEKYRHGGGLDRRSISAFLTGAKRLALRVAVNYDAKIFELKIYSWYVFIKCADNIAGL